jgi:hypothetical protein
MDQVGNYAHAGETVLVFEYSQICSQSDSYLAIWKVESTNALPTGCLTAYPGESCERRHALLASFTADGLQKGHRRRNSRLANSRLRLRHGSTVGADFLNRVLSVSNRMGARALAFCAFVMARRSSIGSL